MGDGRAAPRGDDSAGLRAGAARTVITPPLGVSLAGTYADRRAVDVHEDLYARALVVEGAGGVDGGSGPDPQIAVVCCDLIGLRAATVAGARGLIERTCGISG